MAEKVEAYQDEHNLTDAEAVRRLVAAGLEQQNQPTREEIAADLEEIQSAVRGVRREITDDDAGELHRAHQVGTVIATVATGVLASLVVLILGVPV
jgi:methylphosphotriester-DNA--protein-cysteine methyltransferase